MQRRLYLLCLGCGGCHVGTVLDDEAERDPDDPTAMRNAVESTYPCPGLSPLYRSRSRAIWISLGLGAFPPLGWVLLVGFSVRRISRSFRGMRITGNGFSVDAVFGFPYYSRYTR